MVANSRGERLNVLIQVAEEKEDLEYCFDCMKVLYDDDFERLDLVGEELERLRLRPPTRQQAWKM